MVAVCASRSISDDCGDQIAQVLTQIVDHRMVAGFLPLVTVQRNRFQGGEGIAQPILHLAELSALVGGEPRLLFPEPRIGSRSGGILAIQQRQRHVVAGLGEQPRAGAVDVAEQVERRHCLFAQMARGLAGPVRHPQSAPQPKHEQQQ